VDALGMRSCSIAVFEHLAFGHGCVVIHDAFQRLVMNDDIRRKLIVAFRRSRRRFVRIGASAARGRRRRRPEYSSSVSAPDAASDAASASRISGRISRRPGLFPPSPPYPHNATCAGGAGAGLRQPGRRPPLLPLRLPPPREAASGAGSSEISSMWRRAAIRNSKSFSSSGSCSTGVAMRKPSRGARGLFLDLALSLLFSSISSSSSSSSKKSET